MDTWLEPPANQEPYRASPSEIWVIEQEVKNMLSEGIVQHSSSPWSLPVALVRKKDVK